MLLSPFRNLRGNGKEKLKTLSARVPQELHRRVDVYCAQQGITITQFLTDAIEAELSKAQEKPQRPLSQS